MRSKQISRPDMIGFSAVLAIAAATLLMIVMTLPRPYSHHGISADLPKVSSSVAMPAAQRTDTLEVWVIRDGTVYAFGEKVYSERLAELIRERLSQGAPKKVFIRADSRVAYSAVAGVMDSIREAGIQDVAFIVDSRESTPSAR